MISKVDWVGGTKVAAIVGTLLTAINQYDGLFGQADLDWVALGLTYLVPFIVFNWGKMKGEK